MNPYTYVYLDPSRGDEPFYVGKGKGARKTKHLSRKDFAPFPNRLRRMGDLGIKPTILVFDAIDEYHAIFQEMMLIMTIGRKDLGTGTLLNLTDGGDGTINHKKSDEHKRKLSESLMGVKHTPERRLAVSKRQLGKPLTDLQKAALSKSQLGKPKSDAARAAMKKPKRLVKCAACGVEMSANGFTRYHAKKCHDARS